MEALPGLAIRGGGGFAGGFLWAARGDTPAHTTANAATAMCRRICIVYIGLVGVIRSKSSSALATCSISTWSACTCGTELCGGGV